MGIRELKKTEPVELDINLVKEIANYVEDGCDETRAALLAGVEPDLFHEWKKLGKEKDTDPIYKVLLFELKRADALFERHHIRNVAIAGDEGDWRASDKLLRNKYPERWARENDKVNNDDKEFTIKIITPTKEDEE